MLEDIEAELPFVKIVKVNTTDYPEFNDRFRIRAVPTILFYQNGEQKEKQTEDRKGYQVSRWRMEQMGIRIMSHMYVDAKM